jgi:hypothetical protein
MTAAHTHDTVPTRHVEANGIRFADRRFDVPGAVPLVFNQHFTGAMDYWTRRQPTAWPRAAK